MTTHILKTCLLAALTSTAVHAENLVINGDFEAGTGKEFYKTPPWYNRGAGLNQGDPARSEQAVIAGSHSAVVNDRYITAEEKFGNIAHVQKTGYTIKEGDSFSLSYEWRPADEHWQRATDTIRFVLYATADNKIGGRVVWSCVLTSDFFKAKHTSLMAVSQTTDVVDSEAVGQLLFVMFYGVDTVNGGTDGTPHFARVDNIEVNAVNKATP
jgi:hypothetical protein